VNFLLLKACGAFLHRKIKAVRCVLGALTGGVSSLVILLPELPVPLSAALKLALGLVLVLIAFGYGGFWRLLKNALVFLVINVVFAGFMLVLSLFFSPLGMIYNNGAVYFDISFLTLIFSTAAAYFLIRILRYLLDVKFNTDKVYTVTFTIGGASRVLQAFADSGNTLTDFFTGKPVIICDKTMCEGLFPELDAFSGEYEVIKGIRFLPFSTINGNGFLPVFKPDSVKIGDKNVNALIGISKDGIKNKNGTNAIFNPKLLL
jgi:stage II sporulation protein GA (sporulation sigma-E factor processing peptidase)